MDTDVLDVLQGILQTDRAFYSTIRFFDGQTRSRIVSAHILNNAAMLGIVRTFMTETPRVTATMTISMDPSGNFFDPVPVVPSAAQIAEVAERDVEAPADTNCSICQESLQIGTRLRTCRHTFHDDCIDQWLQVNTRCPVCRHDVRDLQPMFAIRRNDQGDSMHSHTG